MKKALKGALLSGLVFPGVGQFWLKETARGIAFLMIVSLALAAIVAKVAGQAFTILEKIESEGGAVDLVAIANTAHASSSEDLIITCASLVLVLAWAGSMIDAYVAGSKKDREDQARNRAGKNQGGP